MKLFQFDAERGTFALHKNGRVVLGNASAQVVYRDAANNQHVCALPVPVPAQRGTDEWFASASDESVRLTWHVSEKGEVSLEAKNEGTDALALDELRVLVVDTGQSGRMDFGAFDQVRFFEHGWQSWSPTRVVSLAQPAPKKEFDAAYQWKYLPHADKDWSQRAEWFTLIGNPAHAALIGFVTAPRQLSEIRVNSTNGKLSRLQAVCFADGISLAPNETYSSEKLWLAAGDPTELYETYAAEVAREMHARVLEQAPTGWCTWYQYFGENTMGDVRANMQKIRAARLPLEVVIIDDGYQAAVGDWTDVRPDKFPDGMRAAADEIRRAGFVPGIWVAPFGARHDSKLALEHPEYLLRDESGEAVRAWEHWGEEIYALDLTRPTVEKYLRDLFRTLSADWGFDFFKLDFLFAGARPGKPYARDTTRAEAYRRGLQVIRETIGEKFLLASGAPMATTVGLADAMRVGADVAYYWQQAEDDLSEPSVVNAMRNSLLRQPFHRRWWLNDADCVLVRGRAAGNSLTLHEVRTLASVVALSGGLTLDSDDLARVTEDRLNILRQIMPPTNLAARSPDFFANDLPGRLELPIKTGWGEWKILAAINWNKRAQQFEVALGANRAYHVFDFWNRKYLGTQRRKVNVQLKPHATALLVVKPVTKRVELLATTFHFAGGLSEVKSFKQNTKSVQVELEKRGRAKGEMFFALPKGKKIAGAWVDGGGKKVKQVARDVVAVSLILDERATVTLEVK